MVRMLIRAAIFLGAAALGLAVASWIVSGFELHVGGFFLAVVVFALLQLLVAWVVRLVLKQEGPAVTAVAGVISTFVALFISTLIVDGLVITGVVAWVFSTLVVWIVSALVTWLAARFLLRDRRAARRA